MQGTKYSPEVKRAMNYSIFDVVLLVFDLPENDLKSGMTGTVIGIYTEPTPAYEIEFCDEDGKTIAQLALPPEVLKPVLSY